MALVHYLYQGLRADKIRAIAGYNTGIPPLHIPTAVPSVQNQERLAELARQFDARIARADPEVTEVYDAKRLMPWGPYGGVFVQRATTIDPPPSADHEPTDEPADLLVGGGGMVAREVGERQWVAPDPSRSVEIALLRVLCEDPIGRSKLADVDPWLGGLDRTLVKELLGTDPGEKPAEVSWFRTLLHRARRHPR